MTHDSISDGLCSGTKLFHLLLRVIGARAAPAGGAGPRSAAAGPAASPLPPSPVQGDA